MIKQNLSLIRQRIHRAALRCGRNPSDIKLVAISKKFPASAIIEALSAGQNIFGENYIQEAASKIETLDTTASFHLVGHLQSNKVKVAARIFHMIETIDSVKIAQSLNKELDRQDRIMDILIQVNMGGESQKSGVSPANLLELLQQIKLLPNLRPQGLMTIPPYTETPEKTRPYFKSLCQLAKEMAQHNVFFNNDKVELSMGMSDDFEIAIEEGASIVRIGTAIFGQRHLDLVEP